MRFSPAMLLAPLVSTSAAAQSPAALAAYPPFTLERTEQRLFEAAVNNEHYLPSGALPP
jgi:hypothetical protein